MFRLHIIFFQNLHRIETMFKRIKWYIFINYELYFINHFCSKYSNNLFLLQFCSRWDSESSTNTATRAATEESTFGSGSPKTDDFGTPERYRGRVANKAASTAEHRQQGEYVLSRQPAAEHGTEQRSADTRGEIPIFARKSLARLSGRWSYSGEKKITTYRSSPRVIIPSLIFRIVVHYFKLCDTSQRSHTHTLFCQGNLYTCSSMNTTLVVSLHVALFFRSIARHKMFVSSLAEATRIRTLRVDPVGSQTTRRRWKIRYATSRCRIYTRVRVAEHHSHRAHPRNYPRSHLPIIRLQTQAIARTMKLVQITRITVLNVMPFVIAGKWILLESMICTNFNT